MQPKSRSPALTAVDKYDLCKSRMLRTFLSEFKETDNSGEAYKKAKGIITKFASEKFLINFRQIRGLYGELTYFYKLFQEQQLTPEMSIGYKADFRGRILGKPTAIDVTTNPFFKDKKQNYEKIPGGLQDGWEYCIGVVDLKNIDSQLFPLMLPRCKDDNIGFFVLVYDYQIPCGGNLYGETSDLQYIVKFNPSCGGDESDAVEEVVASYNYMLSKPELVVQEINASDTMDMMKEDITPKIESNIQHEIDAHFNDIALFFRKQSGVTISAIVDTSTETIGYKDNIVDVSKQFWVHPHEYIRRNIGDQGEIMDYDIAAYVHDNF